MAIRPMTLWPRPVPAVNLDLEPPMRLPSAKASAPTATFSERDFRDALGRFVTGVTVVTTRAADGKPVGVTINSFTSVSLDPPLVLFCLDVRSRCLPAFEACGGFAVHVLGADQRDWSVRFAGGGDRWDGIGSTAWETGAPIIEGCLAVFECRLEAVHDGGDHTILVGRVIRLASGRNRRPLAYHLGRYTAVEDV